MKTDLVAMIVISGFVAVAVWGAMLAADSCGAL